jgi:hypothetical protein
LLQAAGASAEGGFASLMAGGNAGGFANDSRGGCTGDSVGGLVVGADGGAGDLMVGGCAGGDSLGGWDGAHDEGFAAAGGITWCGAAAVGDCTG